MPETAITELIKVAIFGPLLVISGYVIYRLYTRLDALNTERINALKAANDERLLDQKDFNTKSLELVKQCLAAIQSSTATTESNRETMQELKQAIKDVADRVNGARR